MSDGQKPTDKKNWGTIFMGPSADKESTIDKIQHASGQQLWNRRTESEYMERIRERAALHIQTMLDKARANAETIRKTAKQWAEKIKQESDTVHNQAKQVLQEAEEIRVEAEHARNLAHEEGYQKGLEQAIKESEEYCKTLHAATASVLHTIEKQYQVIFENWRSDLVHLLRTATEVSTGWILSEEHVAVLESLLYTAVQQLEDRQHITIRVHPKNKAPISDVITGVQKQFPELKTWELQTDTSIKEHDLIVESRSGMVDSNSKLRQEEVAAILQHLTIPESTIEATAIENITTVKDSTGIIPHTDMVEHIQSDPHQEDSQKESITNKELETEHLNISPESSLQLEIDEEQYTFPELEGIELPPDIPMSSQESTSHVETHSDIQNFSDPHKEETTSTYDIVTEELSSTETLLPESPLIDAEQPFDTKNKEEERSVTQELLSNLEIEPKNVELDISTNSINNSVIDPINTSIIEEKSHGS